MGIKKIIYGSEVQQGILRGVEKMALAVGCTLGPRGQNVVIEKPGLIPTITFDGVTVAKEISLGDPWEDMGVRLCKEVSGKTNELSGDGTTTATILAYSLLREALIEVAAGNSPFDVRNGILSASHDVLYGLGELAIPVRTRSDIVSSAKIACGSSEVAEVIADAIDEVGRDGVITVEDGQKVETYIESTSGMELTHTGMEHTEFINSEDATCVLKDPVIFCLDGVLDSPMVVANLLNECLELERRSILFIADAFGQDVNATLLRNIPELRSRVGGFEYCAIKTPLVGRKRKDILEDIAVLTGAEICSKDKGDNPLTWKIPRCGSCTRVQVFRDKALITGGDGSSETISERVSRIRYEISESASEYDRQKLQERLGKLTGGITVIRVGAVTEVEMREKKRRIEDALSSTRAAIEEGLVPGGGTTLLRLGRSLDEHKALYVSGSKVVKKALEAPIRALCRNSGVSHGEILSRISEDENWDLGYDVCSGTFVSFNEAGIMDPVKVLRLGLENAVSFAVTALMAAVAITEKNPISAEMLAREV